MRRTAHGVRSKFKEILGSLDPSEEEPVEEMAPVRAREIWNFEGPSGDAGDAYAKRLAEAGVAVQQKCAEMHRNAMRA